jgi:D-threo-aldose 1-dehydrogenase
MLGRRRLGRGDVDLTVLGYGGGALGRMASDEIADATLSRAWDVGIRYFDTAPLYGVGDSERRLGRFLPGKPRGEFVLSTKVGRLLGPAGEIIYDYSRDGALRSLELSLGRLGLDRIDIVLVHDIDAYTHGAGQPERMAQALAGALPALGELREQKVIRAVGLGVNEWQVCRDVAQRFDLDCVLLAGRYTLLEQGAAAEFLPLCRERGIGVIIGGPLNSGILATGAAGAGTYNYKPPPAAVAERVGRLEAALARHGVPLTTAALQYPLGEPSVASIIPGMASPTEVDADLAHLQAPIPAAAWDDLRQAGLIV